MEYQPTGAKHLLRRMGFVLISVVVLGMFLLSPAQAQQDVPTATLELMLEGPNRPVEMVQAPDGRFFYAQQNGRIYVIEDWTLAEQPVLNISSRTPVTAIERGLLGMTLDPNFAVNQYIYVIYTMEDTGGNAIVSRFQLMDDHDATIESELVLLDIPQPYADHNGGQLVFGPDGYLYVGVGDGGGPPEAGVTAQDRSNLLGSILRIDVHNDTDEPYGIPADNPFISNRRGLPEIWLYGFRNPWRFSFDSVSGDLYIADVGHTLYEEINLFRAGSTPGLNYGWNYYEGPERMGNVVLASHEQAIYSYPHRGGCAAIGGFVYRGEQIPALDGYYLYTDYCNRDIWWLRQIDGVWETEVLIEHDLQFVTFVQDNEGELYVVSEFGEIFKLVEA